MKKSKIKKLVEKLVKKELKHLLKTSYAGVVESAELIDQPTENPDGSTEKSDHLFLQ